MPITLNGTTGIVGPDGSAASPAIQGSDANTGMFFPGNDRIGFAEGGVQVGEFDANGNFLMNSGYGSVAIAYGCRAWVNFNGTGTVAIRASGNVTSITDNGVGQYTVNFTTAMPDANYSVVTQAQQNDTVAQVTRIGTLNTGSVSVQDLSTVNGTFYDVAIFTVAIFR